MALYAFDGTWNIDHPEQEENAEAGSDGANENEDTNVVRFRDLYLPPEKAFYQTGVGTKMGGIGQVIGGAFGVGGKKRVSDQYEQLVKQWVAGDQEIDVIGFSRGAALAIHFCNMIAEKGIEIDEGEFVRAPEIRFLGLWDVVASFGLSFDSLIDFHSINLGYDLDRVPNCVQHCHHAMALDERRETFGLTRLNEDGTAGNVEERWFRGVHSDVGGGNKNVTRSNIALQWMIEKAVTAGVPIDQRKAESPKYSDIDLDAPVRENKDVVTDPRREIGDAPVDESARAIRLKVGEAHRCKVNSELRYNWSRIELVKGERYRCTVADDQKWFDADKAYGPSGWESEEAPFFKEGIIKAFESRRRHKEAAWFELIGAINDEDDYLFRLGEAAGPGGHEFTAPENGEMWLFANDLDSTYGNNEGTIEASFKRLS